MNEPGFRRRDSRLVSLDAYRGFVMLAMVSGGFAFARTIDDHPSVLDRYDGTFLEATWEGLWTTLAFQFSHVPWAGCSFWDLIQPSFMFMVGVAMPFSFARRAREGDEWWEMLLHVLWRSILLVALGVFLSSNWQDRTHFTFVNVLTQIGLGYPVLFLLLGRKWWLQLAAIAAILGGYWYWFYQYEVPPAERERFVAYMNEQLEPGERERALEGFDRFDGPASHWNKHTNAAADWDREFLNRFIREEEPWNGRRFWINTGGYQTLNFIPSIATMILGLMAGQMLWERQNRKRVLFNLLGAGVACFVLSMAVDTTIWPFHIDGWDWTLCPAVKRIWTPSWAVFSAGWSFVMLGAFYFVIDVLGWKSWAFPLKVVGMNSIAMYIMAQLLKPWISKTLDIHLTTLDAWLGTATRWHLFSESYPYAAIVESLARLAVLWLICLWLYRRKLFVKI